MQQHTPQSFQYGREESISISVKFSFSVCSPISEIPDEGDKDTSCCHLEQTHFSPTLGSHKSPVACSTPTVINKTPSDRNTSLSVFNFADLEYQLPLNTTRCRIASSPNAERRKRAMSSYSDDEANNNLISDHSDISNLSDDLFDTDFNRQRGIGISEHSQYKTPSSRPVSCHNYHW